MAVKIILIDIEETQEQVSLMNICNFSFDSVYIHCISFFDILMLCF